MEKKVLRQIEEYGLIAPGARVGAAVSGGADSMAMLVVLKELGYDVTALHFEHGIRGEESKADMRFVEDFCEKHGIPFFADSASVPSMREKGESEETAARRLRYAFFERAARELSLDVIATAHHADDNAETVIMNLLRGSGVKGLSGISPRRGIYVRPMLSVTRAQIEDYLKARGIPFVTDSTNLSDEYTRNKVRNQILPLFREINPSCSETIGRACALVREQYSAFSDIAEAELSRVSLPFKRGVALDINELAKMPEGLVCAVIRKAVLRVCSLKDVEKAHTDAVVKLVREKRTGKSFAIEGKFAAFVSYNRLIIADKLYKIVQRGEFALSLSGLTQVWDASFYASCANGKESVSASDLVQFFDEEKLAHATVRTRRTGDVIRLLGGGGTKRIKELFIDEKIPAYVRDAVPLICRGSEVLWAVGVAVSDSAKVDANTKSIIRLEYRP